ncbi:MAG: type II and III secretion system protein [Planctomycetes bacterium]|nr:type II and III secretion system protein [Planctomycetota bacterium]
MAFSFIAGCSSLTIEAEQVDDLASEPAIVAEEAVAPTSFQEEFPYLRMTEHDDDTYSVLITVPLDSGEYIKARIGDSCPYTTGDNPRTTVDVHSHQGKVYSGPNKAHDTGGKFTDIEDLLLVRGNENDVRGILYAIDYWFNSAPQIEIQAEVFETSNAIDNERGFVHADDPLFADSQTQTFLKTIGVSFGTSSNPSTAGIGSGMATEISMLDSSFNLGGVIQVLQQEGFVDILSQPRIVTRSGVTAEVSSTEEIPYLEITTVNLAGANQYKISTKSAGVNLTVTPVLVGADTIHMIINVTVSRLGRDFVIGSDASNNPIVAPSLNSRYANDNIYVRNGQYVVIGGLKLKSEKINESKVPFLGDIPLLGWLFSSKETSEEETSVSFVIRPVLKQRPSIEPFGDYFDPFAEESIEE